MSGFHLFKKLGIGAKFDLKRFKNDAERLCVLPSNRKTVQDTPPIKKRKIDQQLTTEAEAHPDQSEQAEEEENEEELESDQSEAEELQLLGGIRSRGGAEEGDRRAGRKKKKKKSRERLAQIKQEQVSALRHEHNIHVSGTDIPDPLTSWGDLEAEYDLHPALRENMVRLGYSEPTAIQRQAVTCMMHRREILACAPTGSGKTAAFLIPIMHQLTTGSAKSSGEKGVRALVLAPTRELAQQILRECVRMSEGLALSCVCIEKVTGSKSHTSRLQEHDIIVTTPKRLAFLLKRKTPLISLHRLEWLVVDESDKLFEEGNYGKTGFRDQLGIIYSACSGSEGVRRAMFSATFTHEVEQWCKLNLDNVLQVYIGARNSATKDISQELTFVGSESGKLPVLRDIIRKGIEPPVLIFVQSKDRAKELYSELVYDNIHVDVIHGDRPQEERDAVVAGYRGGTVWVLVCTEVLGRGMDFPGVNLVINYDFPNSAISYIHRIGRTGRAGRKGRAITFFTEKDTVNLRCIANVLHQSGCPVPEYMLHIKPPNKSVRRKLAKKAVFRRGISTIPQSHATHTKRKSSGKRKAQKPA